MMKHLIFLSLAAIVCTYAQTVLLSKSTSGSCSNGVDDKLQTVEQNTCFAMQGAFYKVYCPKTLSVRVDSNHIQHVVIEKYETENCNNEPQTSRHRSGFCLHLPQLSIKLECNGHTNKHSDTLKKHTRSLQALESVEQSCAYDFLPATLKNSFNDNPMPWPTNTECPNTWDNTCCKQETLEAINNAYSTNRYILSYSVEFIDNAADEVSKVLNNFLSNTNDGQSITIPVLPNIPIPSGVRTCAKGIISEFAADSIDLGTDGLKCVSGLAAYTAGSLCYACSANPLEFTTTENSNIFVLMSEATCSDLATLCSPWLQKFRKIVAKIGECGPTITGFLGGISLPSAVKNLLKIDDVSADINPFVAISKTICTTDEECKTFVCDKMAGGIIPKFPFLDSQIRTALSVLGVAELNSFSLETKFSAQGFDAVTIGRSYGGEFKAPGGLSSPDLPAIALPARQLQGSAPRVAISFCLFFVALISVLLL